MSSTTPSSTQADGSGTPATDAATSAATSVPQTVVDTWLGDGAVLATLHLPATARTGVVIVPPLGYEYTVAYRTLRHLADRIAGTGLAAVRFDHAGFGDSTVPVDADSLDVGPELAAAALRSAGVDGIVYLGLGSGALVASRAAHRDPDARGLVLWDAAASGRTWLRRQRSLYQIEVGQLAEPAADESTVVVAGAEFPLDVVEVVQSLEFDPVLAERMPVMVAIRAGKTGALPKSLRGVADALDVIEVPGHEDSLDLSSILATIPGASVRAVVDWLGATYPAGDEHPALSVPVATTVATFEGDGVALEENLVRVGPNALFGIETLPAASADAASSAFAPAPTSAPAELPAVLLHNGSSEHRTGATRHQVELARRLAARGMRVLRVDRRGTGETGVVSPDEPNMLYTQEWLDDSEDSLAYLALPRERLGIVGMCIGGWIGLAGSARSTKFITAFSLNDYRVNASAPQVRTEGIDDPASAAPVALKDRLVAVAKKHFPYPLLLALASRGVVQFVEPNLRAALASGTDVLVVNGPEDTTVFAAHGGRRARERLRPARLPATAGRLTVVERATGDHALYSPGIRQAALDAAVEQAVRSFGLPPRP